MARKSDGLSKKRFRELETIAHEEGIKVETEGRSGYPTREDHIRSIRKARAEREKQESGER